jgi:hypothetical protein
MVGSIGFENCTKLPVNLRTAGKHLSTAHAFTPQGGRSSLFWNVRSSVIEPGAI